MFKSPFLNVPKIYFLISCSKTNSLASSMKSSISVNFWWVFKIIRWLRWLWDIVDHKYVLILQRVLINHSLTVLVADIIRRSSSSLHTPESKSNWAGNRLEITYNVYTNSLTDLSLNISRVAGFSVVHHWSHYHKYLTQILIKTGMNCLW